MCGCFLLCPLLGTWPATQARALTGNPTGDPLVLSSALNPLSHTSQGYCLFILLMVSFTLQKLFSLMQYHLFTFSFVSLAWENISDKLLLQARFEILLPMFPSRIFMVLSLIFKSLIHFEFILVCGIRKWSSFIFVHISVQFSQHHLLNKLYLYLIVCACFLCQILIYQKGVVYFWTLYSVSLIYVSIFMPVPCCFHYYGLIVQFDIR